MSKKLIVGVIVVIVVLLIAPIIPVIETYNVEEPFQRQATYSVVDWDLVEKISLFDVYVESKITLRNTDKEEGTFTITHKLYDINGLFGSVKDTNYIGPGQTYISIAKFDTKWGQDTKGTYEITPPTIIDMKIVEKTRTVYKTLIQLLLYRR